MRCQCLLCSIVTNHSPVIGGQKDVVVGRAVAVAGASLDEHHLLLHQFSVRTFKLHVEGGGAVRGAAPAVRAHSAELGPVGPRAGAAGKFKLHRLGQPRGTNTLLAFLDAALELGVAGTDHAQPALLLQAAFLVVVGHSGGDVHSALPCARTPVSGLDNTVLTHLAQIRPINSFLSINCHGSIEDRSITPCVTNPLLATLSRDLDPSGRGTIRAGQTHIVGTERNAADGSIHASTLILAAWLEGLPAPVDHSSHVACCTLPGQTDAALPGVVCGQLAVQAPVPVAGEQGGAIVPHLASADLAATAAVSQHTHPGRAVQGSRVTATGVHALLGTGSGSGSGPTQGEGQCKAPCEPRFQSTGHF